MNQVQEQIEIEQQRLLTQPSSQVQLTDPAVPFKGTDDLPLIGAACRPSFDERRTRERSSQCVATPFVDRSRGEHHLIEFGVLQKDREPFHQVG